ncbi:hypothetical protein NDA12_001963 [Ustilago hordei]|nr:hypothetical protein NDA12_001963 [Ustilago hordei]
MANKVWLQRSECDVTLKEKMIVTERNDEAKTGAEAPKKGTKQRRSDINFEDRRDMTVRQFRIATEASAPHHGGHHKQKQSRGKGKGKTRKAKPKLPRSLSLTDTVSHFLTQSSEADRRILPTEVKRAHTYTLWSICC